MRQDFANEKAVREQTTRKGRKRRFRFLKRTVLEGVILSGAVLQAERRISRQLHLSRGNTASISEKKFLYLLRTLELHRHRFPVRGRRLKKLPLLESEHPGKNVRRERLNLCVQIPHHRVVIAARILDRVFRLA